MAVEADLQGPGVLASEGAGNGLQVIVRRSARVNVHMQLMLAGPYSHRSRFMALDGLEQTETLFRPGLEGV